jgi:hypothetical protein
MSSGRKPSQWGEKGCSTARTREITDSRVSEWDLQKGEERWSRSLEVR